jgi:membrane protein DedA with SNARE-associated domain
MPSLQTLTSLLSHYGYFLLLPLAIVEGPIVTVIAAFLASMGIFNIYAVYAIAIFGDFAGDSMWYWAARSQGERFLHFVIRHGKKMGITNERVDGAEMMLKAHFYKTVVVGKVTNIVMLPIIIASGALRVPYRKFITATLSLDVPKDLIFTVVGFYFGKYFARIDSGLNKFYFSATALLVVGGIFFTGLRYVRAYFTKKYEIR